LPQARGFETRPLLDQAYAALKPKQLSALGKKYQAGYAVLPKSSGVNFEIVYQNDDYRLVRLPAQE